MQAVDIEPIELSSACLDECSDGIAYDIGQIQVEEN